MKKYNIGPLVLLTLLFTLFAAPLALAQTPPADPGPVVTDTGGVTFTQIMAVLVAIVLAARLIVKITPTPADDSVLEKIVGWLKHIGLKIDCFVLLASLTMFTGCAQLDKAGVYANDKILYQSELTITTSYDLIHSYVTWEKDNRVLLAGWPEIKRSADHMRANSKQWFASAYALRDAYAANPTDENRAALQRSLNVLNLALNEAVKYMALAAQPKP